MDVWGNLAHLNKQREELQRQALPTLLSIQSLHPDDRCHQRQLTSMVQPDPLLSLQKPKDKANTAAFEVKNCF